MRKILSRLICLFTLTAVLVAAAPHVAFKTKTIKVGGVAVVAEIADTPEKSTRGLMFRKKLDEGTGMLFIFPDEEIRSFWMKNTFIDLSIGFFDAQQRLVDIQDMRAVKSEMEINPPTYQSAAPAKYALEVPRGWFQKHKIKVGDKLTGL
jgi:hypothetical protein